MARLLSVIPWVAEHSDGVLLDDVVERFDYPRKQLLSDLQDVVFFVGVYPFTPDSLIEVDVSEDRVKIRYADWFSKPLRLAPADAARLLTAGRSVLPLTGEDKPEAPSPLLRALTKLGTALGEAETETVSVRLGAAEDDTLTLIREALAARRCVEIDYYSFGRNVANRRLVEPARLFADSGNWYLGGWCHLAQAERVFRVDRVASAIVTDQPVERTNGADPQTFSPAGDDPRVTMILQPSAHWVTERYPYEALEDGPGDSRTVTMAVSAVGWLERLLLQLGSDAEVVSCDPPLEADLAAKAAERILQRYR